VVKPCALFVIPRKPSLSSKKIASLTAKRGPCLPNPLSVAVKASSMSPVVHGRRFDAAVPGPRRVANIGTYGPPMSPLRHPAKAGVMRSLSIAAVRLV
jgi:hypothetical protein